MANEKLCKIIAGPSKYDLMLALFDATSEAIRPVIIKTLDGPCGGGPYTLHIDSVGREDGSGESWNIVARWYSHSDQKSYRVRGYYSTKSRSGSMAFSS